MSRSPCQVGHMATRSSIFRLPVFEESVARGEQGCIALVGMVKSPANFGEWQRVGVDKVPILPTGLKFLLEGEKGAIRARIAKTGGQEVNARCQEGGICVIDIALWRKAETDYVSSLPFQVLYRPGKEKFHCARSSPNGTAHEVESPAIAPVNRDKGHKGMHLVGVINGQRIDLFLVAMGIKMAHAEAHLLTAFAGEPVP